MKEEIKFFNDNNGNPNKIWNKAKNKIFKKEEALIDCIIDKNEPIIRSKNTSEVINGLFIDKINNLKNNLKQQVEDPMLNYNKCIKTPTKLLMIKEIDMNQLKSIFSKTKKSNSASADRISGNMIKIIKQLILPLILNLINNSIRSKKFPEKIKIKKILPKWKNHEDTTDMNRLRPINIISILSKLIEKTIAIQITNYLIENNLVSQSLQGGLKNRNSTTTVVSLYERICKLASTNKPAAIVTMDQSAAFDMVNHNILEKKLIQIGLKFESVKLIMNYLKNRKQFTEINTHESSLKKCLDIGMYQDSTLSCLLYVIYSLDIGYNTHINKHKHNINEYKCGAPKCEIYIDDVYATISGEVEKNI